MKKGFKQVLRAYHETWKTFVNIYMLDEIFLKLTFL